MQSIRLILDRNDLFVPETGAAAMEEDEPQRVRAFIVALPETAGSALYGMVDVLAATGTLWRELVGEEPGRRLIEPQIVSLSREPFRCGNGIPVSPDLAIGEATDAEIVVLRSCGWRQATT